jgi:tRNA-2-methylthio-N6-dimethylallyladenosine synthase
VALIGQEFEILVEGLSKSARKDQIDDPRVGGSLGDGEAEGCADDHPQLVGRSRCDRIVVFDGNPRLIGQLVDVHVYDCTQTTLLGAIVTREFRHTGSESLPILA